MRGKFGVIIIIFVFLLNLYGCNSNTDITEIEIINTQNGEKIVSTEEDASFKKIITAINKKEKSDKPIEELFTYEIHLYKKNEIEIYLLSFDIENKSAYISKDEKVYKIKDKESLKLLTDEIFYYMYIDKTIHRIAIQKNEDDISITSEYQWTYRDAQGHYVKKEGILFDDKEIVHVTDEDKFSISYEKIPDNEIIKIYKDGRSVYTGSSLMNGLNSISTDGEYLVEVNSTWLSKENSRFYGNQSASFIAEIDRPADFSILTKENYPGNILAISIENLNEDETVKILADVVKIETDIFNYKDKHLTLFPIDLYAVEGEYEITAIFNEGKMNEYIKTKKFDVKNKSFKTQYLQVEEGLNESNNDDTAILEFAQLVKPARTNTQIEKMWEGPFEMPIEGKLTTDFAEIRYVNNQMSSSRHSGIDLAAPKGTEVKAPNNGVVTFAMAGLLSPGNTIVIDHGMGLFTSYYHLDSILVKVGDNIKKGDIIGTVGSTGFSTGPHLHYAVSIYNTYVNPYQPFSGIID